MTDAFFNNPIPRSPCARTSRHWMRNESRRHYTLMDGINVFRLQLSNHGQR